MTTTTGDPFAVDPNDREVVLYQRTAGGRVYRTEPMLSTLLAELPNLLAAGRLVTVVMPDGSMVTADEQLQLEVLELEAALEAATGDPSTDASELAELVAQLERTEVAR